jgi:hypothetical protein
MSTKLSARQQAIKLRINGKGRPVVKFPCDYEGERRWHTFTEWSKLTGVNRETIKTRYFNDRTARQCIGLDKIPFETKRQIEVKKQKSYDPGLANSFLLGWR